MTFTALLVAPCQVIAGVLRSHKKEPQVFVLLVSSILSVLIAWHLSKHYGLMGAALGYLFVQILSLIGCYKIYRKYEPIYRMDAEKNNSSHLRQT